MWTWIQEVFSGMFSFLAPFWGKKKGVLLLLGLDKAGKSSLMFRLKEDRMAAIDPTARPTCESLRYGQVTFTAWDLGGHRQARRLWRDYFPVADAIIFIIDASDPERFPESCAELKGILSCEETKDVPVAVLVNKIDVPGAAGPEELVCKFGLYNLQTGLDGLSKTELQGKRPFEMFPCSVLKRQGYGTALIWISKYF